jgi:type IV pilus assembly protein PilQ
MTFHSVSQPALRTMLPRHRQLLRTLVVLGVLGIASPAFADGAPNHVSEVRASASEGGGSEVVVVGTATAKFSARLDGKRLLVDLTDTDLTGAPAPLNERVGLVSGVMTQAFKTDAGTTTRVTISLTEAATFRVRADGNVVRITLSKGDAADAKPETTAAAPKADAPAAGPASVRSVKFARKDGVDRVSIDLAGDATWTQGASSNGRSRLEIKGAKVGKELERTLDVGAFGGLVKTISTFHGEGTSVVLEVDRDGDAVGTIAREGNTLVWSFQKKSNMPSTQSGVGADGGVARKTRTVAREEAIADLPRVETHVTAEETSGEAAGFVSGPLGQTRGGAAAGDRARRFTGARVDIDLKDADIHNVLRILADVGHVNIVTADNVKGDVTLRLRNVPWDQALDVVLQAKSLGMTRNGNMVRVALLADLEKEREMLIARRKQDLDLAPVETRLIPVSYSHASDLQARAKDLLSSRGSIAVDDRTNMLIARDVSGNLNQIEELVRSLDTQTAQVLVEARIVEATSRYLRDVGIQWGGDASFAPATGNPTGLAFPNSVGIVGGGYDANTPTAGLSPFTRNVQNPNFAVNLPAAVGTGQGGALGLTFGSINNTINLGLRLSAAESSGMLRIVSSPRILTLDNKEARIAQGTLIPFSQISAQGVQTNFQEAKLQLLVKPHVTADGSIAMHVKINRDEPDFNQTSARGDPTILKREAETDLLIMDGHTAVIGGIFTRNTGRNLDQVPFFGDIPLLGVLFQRRRASDSRGELVIFLTPRIVNRAEALGK